MQIKGRKERIIEFVNYHKNGDGECNNVVLKEWATSHCSTLQEKYELAYFFSITYCVESAIILFTNKKEIYKDITKWIKSNKDTIIFQSDRKYIRMKDSFEKVLRNFEKNNSVDEFLSNVTEDGVIILSRAIPYVSLWDMFGRFSAFLFLETLVELTQIPIENTTIEWKRGNTATSGLMNVFGFDKEAEHFDKTGKLALSEKTMDKMLDCIIRAIRKSGGNENVTEIETSLCAYRKFYKGTRYNGYYLDRMLEEIVAMQDKYPEISEELMEIRKKHFDSRYLGEVSGWNGIRKHMKKSYLETGMV